MPKKIFYLTLLLIGFVWLSACGTATQTGSRTPQPIKNEVFSQAGVITNTEELDPGEFFEFEFPISYNQKLLRIPVRLTVDRAFWGTTSGTVSLMYTSIPGEASGKFGEVVADIPNEVLFVIEAYDLSGNLLQVFPSGWDGLNIPLENKENYLLSSIAPKDAVVFNYYPNGIGQILVPIVEKTRTLVVKMYTINDNVSRTISQVSWRVPVENFSQPDWPVYSSLTESNRTLSWGELPGGVSDLKYSVDFVFPLICPGEKFNGVGIVDWSIAPYIRENFIEPQWINEQSVNEPNTSDEALFLQLSLAKKYDFSLTLFYRGRRYEADQLKTGAYLEQDGALKFLTRMKGPGDSGIYMIFKVPPAVNPSDVLLYFDFYSPEKGVYGKLKCVD